jgi:uncharacterized protein with HEPN domain
VTTEKGARDLEWVTLMIEAIKEAMEDSAGGEREFRADPKTQRAVTLDLIHLVESASKVSPGFKQNHPKVPWDLMSELRNHGLVHEYAEVDLDSLWAFVRDQLPGMARHLGRAKARPER